MIELFTNAVVVAAIVLWGYYLGAEGYRQLNEKDTLGGKVWTWAVIVTATAAYAAAIVCAHDLISGRY